MDIVVNDQISHADEYKPLVVGYKNGAAIGLSDVADVIDSTQNIRTAGYLEWQARGRADHLPSAGRQHHRHRWTRSTKLPSLKAAIPNGIEITTVLDRTTTIRQRVRRGADAPALHRAGHPAVVFIFLRNGRATLIPGGRRACLADRHVCRDVPARLFSIDNLSLMALTISTGFVVDDAIVVMENIARHLEEGKSPFAAALLGAKEIGFTVLSISISLIAVFIPLLLMGGIVGRLFREFAITLSTAIMVSMVISLTTTPMMCAYLLKSEHGREARPVVQHHRAVF